MCNLLVLGSCDGGDTLLLNQTEAQDLSKRTDVAIFVCNFAKICCSRVIPNNWSYLKTLFFLCFLIKPLTFSVLQILLRLWCGDAVQPMHVSWRADARHGHTVRLRSPYRVQHAAAQLNSRPRSPRALAPMNTLMLCSKEHPNSNSNSLAERIHKLKQKP